MKFRTESGSEYEIREHRIRRTNDDYGKRADGDWVDLLNKPHIEVGHSAFLLLESLAEYGEDDYGARDYEVSQGRTTHTFRTTSTVTEIIE